MGSQWGKRLRATFLWRSLFWRAKSAAERAVAKAAMIIERQHSKVDQNLPKLETNENGESKTSNAFPEDFGHLPSESSHQEEGAGGLSRRESFSQIVVEAAPTAKQGLLPVDDSSISGNREENGLGIVASIGGTFRRLLSMTWFTANDQHRADTFGNPYSMFDDEPLPPSGGNSAQNEKNANHSLKPRPKMISTSSDVLADIDGQDVEDNDDKNQFVIEDGH
ncbi:hypothetical protein DFJ73DRAFT_347724 [Zopfochytrium polystomum]|nr:hypothetical protein DFJ73DRAFT_347724 [Zopfochytrium polystomum]